MRSSTFSLSVTRLLLLSLRARITGLVSSLIGLRLLP